MEKISRRTGRLIGLTLLPENGAGRVALSANAVWVRAQQGEVRTALHKIERATHRLLGAIELHRSGGRAVTNDAVWVIDAPDLLRIDPHSRRTVATYV